MLENFPLEKIVEPLLEWFSQNARSLPWREHPAPYEVWVSEIMLQQTRVEAVKPYFARFLKALPTIKDLAGCPEEQLLKLWEGLGYYNRVRNMQAAARTVVASGRLPEAAEAKRHWQLHSGGNRLHCIPNPCPGRGRQCPPGDYQGVGRYF